MRLSISKRVVVDEESSYCAAEESRSPATLIVTRNGSVMHAGEETKQKLFGVNKERKNPTKDELNMEKSADALSTNLHQIKAKIS